MVSKTKYPQIPIRCWHKKRSKILIADTQKGTHKRRYHTSTSSPLCLLLQHKSCKWARRCQWPSGQTSGVGSDGPLLHASHSYLQLASSVPPSVGLGFQQWCGSCELRLCNYALPLLHCSSRWHSRSSLRWAHTSKNPKFWWLLHYSGNWAECCGLMLKIAVYLCFIWFYQFYILYLFFHFSIVTFDCLQVWPEDVGGKNLELLSTWEHSMAWVFQWRLCLPLYFTWAAWYSVREPSNLQYLWILKQQMAPAVVASTGKGWGSLWSYNIWQRFAVESNWIIM